MDIAAIVFVVMAHGVNEETVGQTPQAQWLGIKWIGINLCEVLRDQSCLGALASAGVPAGVRSTAMVQFVFPTQPPNVGAPLPAGRGPPQWRWKRSGSG